MDKMKCFSGVLFVLCLLLKTGQASEGLHFALAFSAAHSDYNTGYCRIYIQAKETTNVTITKNLQQSTYVVQTNETFIHQVSVIAFRTELGIENKGILIDADSPITVMLGNARQNYAMETIQALPKYDGLNEYAVITYSNMFRDDACGSSNTLGFYSVIPYEDDTIVSIYKPVNGVYEILLEITLQKFQVYTNRTVESVDARRYDFTGYYITGNKPISVTAGNACALLGTIGNPIWSSMPSVELLGTSYISHPTDEAVKPYTIRVLSLSSNTMLTAPGIDVSETLNLGEFITLDDISGSTAQLIECSQPCLVAQYSSSRETISGVFMAVLSTVNRYITNVAFTLPDTFDTIEHFINIVIETNDIISTEISLDSVDISDNPGWSAVTGNYYTLTLPMTGIEESKHELISMDPTKPLSLLVFGHGNQGHGYGYIAGIKTTDSSEPENPERTSPQYKLAVTGLFRSTTGEDFTASCTADYGLQMNIKAVQMASQVNSVIGSQLCAGHTSSEIYINKTLVTLNTNGNEGTTEITYILNTDLNTKVPEDVEACTSDIHVYLMDHTNWPDPILPTQPGCPGVVFTSAYFNDTGSVWICEGGVERESLVYALLQSGDCETINPPIDISIDCSRDYNEDLSMSTIDQISKVNSLIMNGSLCSGSGNQITLGFAATSFTSQGNLGQTLQDYVFQIAAGTPSNTVNICGAEVSAYLKTHTNWIQPIVEAAACPMLVFIPETFIEVRQDWVCV